MRSGIRLFASAVFAVGLAAVPAVGVQPRMYWAEFGGDPAEIRRAHLDGSNVEVIVTGLVQAWAVALDTGGGKLYWTQSYKLQRANLDGSNLETLISSYHFSSNDIALAPLSHHVYWTRSAGDGGSIRRADFDGTNVQVIVAGLGSPRGIALDVPAGKIYWTNWAGPKIQRANMDGSDIEDLVVTGLGYPRGIDLDLDSGKMYWVDSETDQIQRANLDGSGIESLVTTGLDFPIGIALDVFGGRMYWTDAVTQKIQRANLDGSNVVTLVSATTGEPWGIALIERDCNGNGVSDDQDLAGGTSADCDGNEFPDECQADCDTDGIPDACELPPFGNSEDCNANAIPDECEPDCNENGVADACDIADGTSEDCNANYVPDECDLAEGTSPDCNSNGVPDECDLADQTSPDCNGNDVPDECDISAGTSADCTGNGIPDECEPDCNGNGEADSCDIAEGTSQDCQPNEVPDECDLAEQTSADCNLNDVPDECDVAEGTSEDCNYDVIPDECQPDEDCNSNGVKDICDIGAGTSEDCNWNLVPDECDIAGGTSQDVDENGIPDECAPAPLPEGSLGLSCAVDDDCPNESVCIADVCYVPKNRVVSFVPVPTRSPVAYEVTSANCPGMVGWVGEPFENTCCEGTWMARVEETPFYSDTWPAVVHVCDGEIHPGAGYAIRATLDGFLLSDPLVLPTVRIYGDVVGRFVDGAWSPPDGRMNMDDMHAACQVFHGEPQAPCCMWTILAGEVPSGCICSDIFYFPSVFSGEDYQWPTSCECTSSDQCADDTFCNGSEVCWGEYTSICIPGDNPCPGELCNEQTDTCDPCQLDADCDDGLFCNGAETCIGGICTRAPYPCGDAGCNEQTDTCGSTGSPLMSLIPVSATGGNPEFVGNRVFFEEGGYRVQLEILVSGWDPDQNGDPELDAYQAAVEAWGYLGANAVPPFPGMDLVPVGYPYHPELGAYVDDDRVDFVFYDNIGFYCLYDATLDYNWGASNFGGAEPDDGQTYYLGTLILEVPVGAAGTYLITFNSDDDFSFLNDPDGNRIGGLTTVPALITLPSDCNDNGIPDAEDIAAGTSEDCNNNLLPDECDIARGVSTDCNANGVPDECEVWADCNNNEVRDICDIAEGTSEDCSGNWIPDECEPDCNTNGIADSCDIMEGTSEDCQPNGVPDECDLSEGTSHDYDNSGKPDECERTNRYLTFAPQTGGPPVAYQVEMTYSAYFPTSTGILGWIGGPFESSEEPGEWIARLMDTPFYADNWPTLLHVGDCQIVPVADYLVRPTEDGINFGDPLELGTITQPAPKYWADVVGAFDGTEWSGPNEIVSMDDVMAAIQKFKLEPGAPHWTWIDIHGEVPDTVVNFTDIQQIVSGFRGFVYPFRDPAACP